MFCLSILFEGIQPLGLIDCDACNQDYANHVDFRANLLRGMAANSNARKVALVLCLLDFRYSGKLIDIAYEATLQARDEFSQLIAHGQTRIAVHLPALV